MSAPPFTSLPHPHTAAEASALIVLFVCAHRYSSQDDGVAGGGDGGGGGGGGGGGDGGGGNEEEEWHTHTVSHPPHMMYSVHEATFSYSFPVRLCHDHVCVTLFAAIWHMDYINQITCHNYLILQSY